MKTAIMLLSLFLAHSSAPSIAHAIQESHGCQAQVKRDANGAILDAITLDLSDMADQNGLVIPDSGRIPGGKIYSDAEIDAELDRILAPLLREPHSAEAVLAKQLRKAVRFVRRDREYIPDGTFLPLTLEAFPRVLREGYAREQLATYYPDHRLLINGSILREMNLSNQVSFWLHEAAYKYGRIALGLTHSLPVRMFVAHAVAANVSAEAFLEVARSQLITFNQGINWSALSQDELLSQLDWSFEFQKLTCITRKNESLVFSIQKTKLDGLQGNVGHLKGTTKLFQELGVGLSLFISDSGIFYLTEADDKESRMSIDLGLILNSFQGSSGHFWQTWDGHTGKKVELTCSLR
jgi:hypothetical protein